MGLDGPLAKAMPSKFATEPKEVDPTAGPDGAYDCIKLTMEVHSRALRAEVGQGLAP